MGANMSMQGMGELHDWLVRAVDNVAEIENEALQLAAEPILKDAQETTAFIDRTGDLRESLKISKPVNKRAGYRIIKVYAARTEGKGYTASLVEYGHSGKYAKAHPFLAPAYERHIQESIEIIKQKIGEALATK